MKKLTYVDPYALGSGNKRSKKRGMCAFETAKKIRRLCAERSKKFEEQFGCFEYPERVSGGCFDKQIFGTLTGPDDFTTFAPTVVGIALFDGPDQLFECTGIALPSGTSTIGLTRFVTSARLAEVFNQKRNREDELTIQVGVPFCIMGPINGFLELYDEDIAIVTSLLSGPDIRPLDLDRQETSLLAGTVVTAVARPFMSPGFLLQSGVLIDEGPSGDDPKHFKVSDCEITELGLGGPLVHSGKNFAGMNIRCAKGKTWFLTPMSIRERLEQFQMFTPRNLEGGYDSGQEDTDDPNLYGAGSSSGTTEISSQGYSPPPGALMIVPSGFMRRQKWLDSMGYPKPPPLMLELNGKLLHTFEEVFGYLRAWRDYPFGLSFCTEGVNPWVRLGSNITEPISRRVVSLASFNGAARFFACTGLLIKCRVGRHYGSVTPSRTVILTSASLFRTCDDTDTIDVKLRIEVFLPPNQRVSGTLVAYDSCYNLAIVSAEYLRVICPEDLLLVDTPDRIRDRQLRKMSREEPELKKVVAVGREPEEGLLCGSMGIVTKEPITRGCKELRLSTCKIKKAGIGGPLINLADGSFVGMNFYDGRTDSTPFLPRRYILKVLRKLELPPSRRDHHAVQRLDSPDDGTNYSNRWPVPKARWYHSLLHVDRPDSKFKSRERQRL